ncbi:MAG TPA: DoxX family protein [Burkholderiales bacterium]|nr:DoxX family protein [Burkholderiales bacterium]
MANDLGKLILRLTLGVLILLHGIAKISGGSAGVEKMLEGAGLPSFFAAGVYVGEVLAPILVIIGFYARIGAALIVVNMLFAIMLAHRADLFVLTKTGGWALELQAFFLFTALALALIGPGRLSINQR